MSGDVRNCAKCGSDQRGDEIPAESRHYYGKDSTHYWRTVMIEVPGVFDGGLYFQCPDCGHKWHRWPETHPLHAVAAPYVAGPR